MTISMEAYDALVQRNIDLRGENERLTEKADLLTTRLAIIRRWAGGKDEPENEIAPTRAALARVAELRGLCNWAAGRLLDAGDIVGHEMLLAALANGEGE